MDTRSRISGISGSRVPVLGFRGGGRSLRVGGDAGGEAGEEGGRFLDEFFILAHSGLWLSRSGEFESNSPFN